MQPDYYQKDIENLKKILRILWVKRKLIIKIYIIVLTLSAIYLSQKDHNIYQANSSLLIGHYYLDAVNRTPIKTDNNSVITAKINYAFAHNNKDYKDGTAKVSSTDHTFFQITAISSSKKNTLKRISEAIAFIKNYNQRQITSIKNELVLKIKNIDNILLQERCRKPNILLELLKTRGTLSNLLEDRNYENIKILKEVSYKKNPNIINTMVVISIITVIFSIFLILLMNTYKSSDNKLKLNN